VKTFLHRIHLNEKRSSNEQCYDTYHISRLSAAFEGERDILKCICPPLLKWSMVQLKWAAS